MNWENFLTPHFFHAGVFLKNRDTGIFSDQYADKYKIALYDTSIYNDIATDEVIVKSASSALKPHLNRLLIDLPEENRNFIKDSYRTIEQLRKQYFTSWAQGAFVLEPPGRVVPPHSHVFEGVSHMTFLFVRSSMHSKNNAAMIVDGKECKFPDSEMFYLVFDARQMHLTVKEDDNYYMYFVYEGVHDLNLPADFQLEYFHPYKST